VHILVHTTIKNQAESLETRKRRHRAGLASPVNARQQPCSLATCQRSMDGAPEANRPPL
jgi:hypothetical protein